MQFLGYEDISQEIHGGEEGKWSLLFLKAISLNFIGLTMVGASVFASLL
jgi:hypothetical protein